MQRPYSSEGAHRLEVVRERVVGRRCRCRPERLVQPSREEYNLPLSTGLATPLGIPWAPRRGRVLRVAVVLSPERTAASSSNGSRARRTPTPQTLRRAVLAAQVFLRPGRRKPRSACSAGAAVNVDAGAALFTGGTAARRRRAEHPRHRRRRARHQWGRARGDGHAQRRAAARRPATAAATARRPTSTPSPESTSASAEASVRPSTSRIRRTQALLLRAAVVDDRLAQRRRRRRRRRASVREAHLLEPHRPG